MARSGRSVLLAVAVVLVVIGGIVWRLSNRPGNEQQGLVAERAEKKTIFALEPGTDPNAPKGTIEGSVVDLNNQPVAGAAVLLVRIRSPDSPWNPDIGRPLAAATTAADGGFRLPEVGAGSYGLTAMAKGSSPGHAGPVDLAAGATETVVVQLGGEGFEVTGRVSDIGGGVVVGATVRAMGRTEVQSTIPLSFEAKTDDSGTYRLFLGKGNHSLMAEADGYAPAFDWIDVRAAITRDLKLSPASRISGRVVEREGGKPVPGAELWLMVDRQRRARSRPRDVKADENGLYVFDNIEPGTYRVGARSERLVGMSAAVSMALAESAEDVEVPVHPGHVVAGRVVDESGKPLADVRVDLWKDQPPFERPQVTKTGDDGTFRLEGILPARYRLQAQAEDVPPIREELQVTADRTGLELRASPAVVLEGRVLTASGQPASGVSVDARVRPMTPGPGGAHGRATTAADGRFEIKGLKPGELILNARHEDLGSARIEREAIEKPGRKTVALKLAAGGSISGRVTREDGQPAANARVQIFDRRFGGAMMMAPVDPDGRYKLSGLGPSTYVVTATQNQSYVFFGSDAPNRKLLDLEAGESKENIDLVIEAGATVSGAVAAPDGSPVVGAEIVAFPPPDPQRFGRGPESARAFSDADGAFTLEGLGKGPYDLGAIHPGYADAEAKGVAGGATGVKLRFPPEASISGVVVTSAGKPIPDYTINLSPSPKGPETPMEKQRRISMAAFEHPTDVVHDPTGQFHFGRVRPGKYELHATTTEGNGGSVQLAVGEGEHKAGVRLVLDPGARLVGQVVDLESGEPLSGLEVRGFAMSALNTRPPSTKTDAQGRFTMDGLTAGSTVNLLIMGDRKMHITERKEVEIPTGKIEVDVGRIALQRGNLEERIKDGTWQGLTGISNSPDDKAMVAMARPGTPAEKAGVKTGDRIIAIGGEKVEGMTFGQIEWRLHGTPGTPITVTVQTPGEKPRTVTFPRFDPARAQTPPVPPRGQAQSGSSAGSGQTGATASQPAPASSSGGQTRQAAR